MSTRKKLKKTMERVDKIAKVLNSSQANVLYTNGFILGATAGGGGGGTTYTGTNGITVDNTNHTIGIDSTSATPIQVASVVLNGDLTTASGSQIDFTGADVDLDLNAICSTPTGSSNVKAVANKDYVDSLLPTKVASKYLRTNASNVMEWGDISTSSGVTYKGIVTTLPTSGMANGDMYFVGSSAPYNINIYNTSVSDWDAAGVFSIDITTKADKDNTVLTGSGSFENLTGSGELSMANSSTVDFSKSTTVKVPTITSSSDGSCAVNKDYIDSLNGNGISY